MEWYGLDRDKTGIGELTTIGSANDS
jgi:hypothetical protein